MIEKKKKINIFEHKLVPKHRKLSDEEKAEVLKKYNAPLYQLPRILITDPAVRSLRAKIGDIIEIERVSENAGKTKYYRVVIVG